MQTIIVFFLFSVSLMAQTPNFEARVKSAYLETDRNYDLDCAYSFNNTFKIITPSSLTARTEQSLSRNFIIETETKKIPLTFTVTGLSRSGEYSVLLNKTYASKGVLAKRDFSLSPVGDKDFDDEFETTKITCHVNFAYASPVVLTDGDYHINVHPHTIYDNQSRLKSTVESYLNNKSFISLILLDTGNFRGNLVNLNNFFKGLDPRLPVSTLRSDLVNVPQDIPLIVSPAGNNRFILNAEKEINVTFTGGNHNYCIWNSTRQILMALLNSKSQAKIVFNYDMASIVAQQTGMQGLSLNFSRQAISKSNLLKDLLSNKSIQENYHASYLIYFRNLFAREYSGMFRTFRLNYRAEGYTESFTVQGNGLKNVEVDFNYF